VADDTNKVIIEAELQNNTAAGMAEVKGEINRGTQEIVMSLGAIQDALEKKGGGGAAGSTDRFGSAIKRVADANGLAAKAVNRLTKMFNPFNIAMGLAVGAVAAFVASLKDAFKEFDNYISKMDEAIKKTQDFIDADSLAARARRMKGAGYGEKQFEAEKLAEEGYKAEALLKDAEKRLEERFNLVQGWQAEGVGGLGTDEELERLRALVNVLRTQTEEIKNRTKARLEEADAERAAAIKEGILGFVKKGTGQGSSTKKGDGGSEEPKGSMYADFGPSRKEMADRIAAAYAWEREQQANAIKAEEDMRIEAFNAEFDQEIARSEKLMELDLMRNRARNEADAIALEERIQDQEEAIRQEEEINRQRMQLIDVVGQASLGLVSVAGKVAAASAKSEKQKQKAEAVTAVVYSSIQAAIELARAIQSFASGPAEYANGALHLVSMAEFIAAAALASKYGGGSVGTTGKSAGGGGAGREAFMPPGDEEGTTRTTIIVEGHIFSPEGGAGFVRDALEASENQTNPGRTRKDMR
jgi:hypothetical protein